MIRCFVLPALFSLGLILQGGMLHAAEEATEGGWKILRFQDHDYITAHSIERFYQFDGSRVLADQSGANQTLWLTSPDVMVKAAVGGRDLWVNNIRFRLNDPVETIDGQACISRLDLSMLLDPLFRPSKTKGTGFDTVVIDPGHGGKDTGGKTAHLTEKDMALQLAKDLKADLEKRGFKVVMTRSRDSTVTDAERVAEANKAQHAIFISLHFGCHAPNGAGVATYIFTPRGGVAHPTPGTQHNAENLQLACAVHATVMSPLKGGMVDRGIEQVPVELLKDLNMPAVMLEPGVISNPGDAKITSQKRFSSDLAGVIGDAIMKYRKTLP
jgi:N-acetylmuramoyl-L-alanine amidase